MLVIVVIKIISQLPIKQVTLIHVDHYILQIKAGSFLSFSPLVFKKVIMVYRDEKSNN